MPNCADTHNAPASTPGPTATNGLRAAVEPDTLFIDCIASALQFKDPAPGFQDCRVVV